MVFTSFQLNGPPPILRGPVPFMCLYRSTARSYSSSQHLVVIETEIIIFEHCTSVIIGLHLNTSILFIFLRKTWSCALLPLGRTPFVFKTAVILHGRQATFFQFSPVQSWWSCKIVACFSLSTDGSDNHFGPLLQGLVSCINSHDTFKVP